MSATKNYVLDTNVLIHDPEAIFKFQDNDVFIPINVIEEVDQFKREGTERGRNCRQFCRTLDDLRTENGTSLSGGVSLGSGKGTLKILIPFSHDHRRGHDDHGAQDRAIMNSAIELRDKQPGVTTIFVTMDTNLRIRADALGLVAETYENSRMKSDMTTSVRRVIVPSSTIDSFWNSRYSTQNIPDDIRPNESVILQSEESETHTAICRYDAKKKEFVQLKVPKEGVMGLRSKNSEQAFALDLLLNDDIQVVTLIGKAGTGKTLLAVAAGLQKAMGDKTYTRVLVSRPVMPLGKDIGFLPGSLDEKMSPWMQPIFDNLEFLHSIETGRSSLLPPTFKETIETGILQVEPLTYIRGRSLPRQFFIVDESQNLTPHEAKTILTRAGEGTKIIFTGDPDQIDNPYVDSASNGLSFVADRFRNEKIAGTVTLTKGERSALAELASTLL